MWTDLGNGSTDHGVAAPISSCRGLVVTIDGDGRNVILQWLFDHRGGYALLMIDAETGDSREFPMPFPPDRDCPYTSILSSDNRFYTHFNGHFVEFDPVARAFTFCGSTARQMAMSMTEDDAGVIWAATFPKSGVVSFDPKTRELTDYGYVYDQNWNQYPRHIAADETGSVYFALGHTATQIIAFDPATRKAEAVLPEEERAKGMGDVYRDINGRAYGAPLEGSDEGWYEFYGGEAKKIGALDQRREKAFITGAQSLRHMDFPDGRRLVDCDLAEHVFTVEDPTTGETREMAFDYSSEGARLMGVEVAPDGALCGGTFFPHRFFRYDPDADAWTNRKSYLQWNTVATQGDRFFVGGYPHGFLLEWDPSQPWIETDKDAPNSNPRFLAEGSPDVYRAHALLAHPDGKTLVLSGTPAYGYTGGGLLFWDRETEDRTLLDHNALLPGHSTMSLVALPDGKLLGGSTVAPGTGGEQLVDESELYILDMATKKLEWRAPVIAGAKRFTDLCPGPHGLIYGIADAARFFVFDPAARRIAHQFDAEPTFGPTCMQQGPRVFVQDPNGATFILFARGIARVDPSAFSIAMVAESAVPIVAGGAFHGGRIYFGHASHLCSCDVSG